MTLAELNAASAADFVDAIERVFEHSPWVAERAVAQRPFSSVDALHAAMIRIVANAARDEQLALLRAHPDLGTRTRVSDASAGEQAGAGLDRLTPAEDERLRGLNASYRERFGFPFLLAVAGSTKQDILDALSTRVTAGEDAEFEEALRQVARIARFRLEDLIRE